jgi:hypothetical protein
MTTGIRALTDEDSWFLQPGEMFVVPKGLERITRAASECPILVVEPRGVVNTGDAGGALTPTMGVVR